MRWGRLLFVVILIGSIGFGLYRCAAEAQRTEMGSQKSPMATVRSAIQDFELRDPAMVTRYFTPIPASIMRIRLEETFQWLDKLDIQDLDVWIVSNDGLAARIQARYNMIMTQDQYIDSQRCNKQIKLVKLEGKWFINEAF